jgi:hypothetical protein
MKMTSTGIKLSIVEGEPATFDEAGFAALTFVKVGQLTSIPEFGPTVQVVESNPLETGITEKFVGFVNYGSTSLEADFDDEDAGQALITDAVNPADASFGKQFSVKLEYQSGAIRYWLGRFFSATENPGSANSMVTTAMNMEINSPVLKVAAP